MKWKPVSGIRKRTASFLTGLFVCVFATAQNPIVTENSLAGNPASEWDIFGAGDLSIQGFATDISVNKGQTIRFKIKVNDGASFTIRIYRIGYYQGNGARLIANLGSFTGTIQPNPIISSDGTGLIDCGNWSESASWAVPSSAVSGIYIAKLTRNAGGGSSHIVFIVRDDAGNSDLLFKTSDATWQAYNNYGGNSLYEGTTSFPSGRASKVSYNRPFVTRSGGTGAGTNQDWLFSSEYPMIRFLERNGYNVSYTTDVDMDRNTSPVTPSVHRVLLSVGHDEYWSAAARTKFENARNAGVHLAFFSGNEVYWKTRWENSHRTLVCYKEGTLGENQCGLKCDPTTTWTGLWRTGGAYDAGRPENSLSGQIGWTQTNNSALTVPFNYRRLRFWRNTSVASLGIGQTATFAGGTLGYEWDFEQAQYADNYPRGRILMSSTTIDGKTHKLSLYRHSSGALVFGAGTIQWAWGLDNTHDAGSGTASVSMQQATLNLLADMGVQPATRQSGLVAASSSTDFAAPATTISSPSNGASFSPGATIIFSGTATDGGGGVVAGVEVSVNGGVTWNTAVSGDPNGTVSWTFSWVAGSNGNYNIRVRGFDDSGNIDNNGTGINITVGSGASTTLTILPQTQLPSSPRSNDGQGIALGVKFRSGQNGFITGIRYYKGAGTTGIHTGQLWTISGNLLAQATFTNETASGWQQVLFSNPVAITAGVTYVASYHSPSGDFAATANYFTQAVVNGPLRGLANGENGPNGLYRYSSTPVFPANGYQSSNYWADVVFTTGAGSDNTAPTVSSVSPVSGASGVNVNTTVIANFSEAINPSTVTGSTFQLRNSAGNLVSAALNTSSNQVVLTPAAALTASTTYTVTITGGASGVKDPAGNALAGNYSWSFTTAASGGGSLVSLFQPTDSPAIPLANDGQGIVVGMKFRSAQNGFVTGVRYYKGTGTTGTHIGSLWTNAGSLLAQATFTNETASGWQQVLFSAPVAITAGVTYVVANFSPSGDYAYNNLYFSQAVVNGSLRGLADGEDGPNGLYSYSSVLLFPNSSFNQSNYWVDLVFSANAQRSPGQAGSAAQQITITDMPVLPGERSMNSLDVQVMPNPTTNLFNLIIHGNPAKPASIKMVDIFGRVLKEYRNIAANKLFSFGREWRSGTYIAEVVQGEHRKTIKIVKAN